MATIARDGRWTKKKVYNEIYQELEELALKDETLRDAFGVWRDLSRSKEEVYAYESRLKYILDEEAKLDDARYLAEKEGRQKGLKEGLEEGREKGREEGLVEGREEGMKKVAKKMISRGDSNEAIMDMTDLTLEEVESLRTNN